MSSRRAYPTAELYDERSRDFYGNGNRSYREYDELDAELTRGGRGAPSEYSRPGRQPDFLRDDYGRTSAGPLVVAERREEDYGRPVPKPRSVVDKDDLMSRRSERLPPTRDLDREEFIYRRSERDDRGPLPRPRDLEREEVRSRRDERDDRSRRPREIERDDLDISIRHREQSRPRPRETEREEVILRRDEREERPRPRPRDIERDELIIRREEREEPPPRRPREIERDEIIFRRGEGARPPPRELREVEREELRIRRSESRPPRSRDEREEIIFRRTEQEEPPRPKTVPPRGDLVSREREEFIIRRKQPPSPPREEKQEIIIRRTERTPSPSPPPSPPSPPAVEPIVRPPIVQEIITHHRHIDHGVERAKSPTPPPPPPSPPKDESLEIAIRSRRGGGKFYDEDIIFERESRDRKDHERDVVPRRRRSESAPRRRATRDDDFDIETEAEYYNRKAQERAYIGEAYNGATKDWAIVDVPPGTNRVRMDGVGGGSQEITWQRYNGVRRSKFLTEDREYPGELGVPPARGEIEPPPRPKSKTQDMWTEITKDLVIKEAIEEMGYDYEETDYFFYVMDYLRYEDVCQLVEISDDIRRERRRRIREIEFERSELDRKPRPGKYDYYEREIFYEHDNRRGRYR